MKKIVLLSVLLLQGVLSMAQEQLDSLYYRTGKVEVVNITKNLTDIIECNYPGEDMVSVIEKSHLDKIVFKSGRIEYCKTDNSSPKEVKSTTTKDNNHSSSNGRWSRGVSASVEVLKEMFDHGECGSQNGIAIGGVVGYRFNMNIFVGGGLRWLYTKKHYLEVISERPWKVEEGAAYYDALPIFATAKFNFTRTLVSPYFRLDVGVEAFNGDFFVNPELGVDFQLGKRRKNAFFLKYGVQGLRGKGTRAAHYGAKEFLPLPYIGLGFRF